MVELLVLLVLGLLLIGVGYLWRRIRIQEQSRQRLAEPEKPAEEEASPAVPARRFVRHHRIIPWLIGMLAATVFYYFVGLPPIFCITFGTIAGLLLGQLETMRVTRTTFRIEEQLSDAIDLMVAALRAGAGAQGALENAASESHRPLRPQLDELINRIRYGEDPQHALKALETRVPLETFRLFASALSVHWETGGSLAPTLSIVGRVIRDRIEVSRRIRALTNQARASTVAVLLVTYFIALIIWRSDPQRMEMFLSTSMGQGLVAGAIILQGVGMVWTAALSRLRY
jgi:Flp pilus assembly protein TadB